jgi:hypothetical protein
MHGALLFLAARQQNQQHQRQQQQVLGQTVGKAVKLQICCFVTPSRAGLKRQAILLVLQLQVPEQHMLMTRQPQQQMGWR